jgi:hypothetical protein
LKQEWQKIPAGPRQTYGNNLVWFGEIERKLAKFYQRLLLLAVLPLNYFMSTTQQKDTGTLQQPSKESFSFSGLKDLYFPAI